MSDRLSNKAIIAVSNLSEEMRRLSEEVKYAHLILDSYGVERDLIHEETCRPLSLGERIKINHEKNRVQILELIQNTIVDKSLA